MPPACAEDLAHLIDRSVCAASVSVEASSLRTSASSTHIIESIGSTPLCLNVPIPPASSSSNHIHFVAACINTGIGRDETIDSAGSTTDFNVLAHTFNAPASA